MLTPEQLKEAETMPLDELRALAFSEKSEEEPKPQPKVEEPESEEPEEEPEGEPETEIYRKEIRNDDGTVDVYEAASVDELIDKIAEAKRQAVTQMKRVQEEKKTLQKETGQKAEDENYVLSERFKTEPLKVVEEVVAKRLQKEAEAKQRGLEAQNRFVATHPDFIVGEYNGNKLMNEFRRLYPAASDFDYEGLEKAYQSLKAGGLLQLKAEGGEEATEAETKEPARTEQPKAETTQPRSSKRSSNVTMRPKAAPAAPNFDESEAYKMPIEQLHDIVNRLTVGEE